MTRTSKEIQDLLKEVVTYFSKEDRAARERQIRTWRQLKLFWEGLQKTYFSEIAHDWRFDEPSGNGDETNQSYYDKPVNVFRAYLESIIAALSVTIPPVKCYPDNADDPLDLSTAKAGDKISNLIYRHNDVSLLWLHGLFIFCTEGMMACYSYSRSSEEYGTYEKKTYKDETEEHTLLKCPSCGYDIDDSVSSQMVDPNQVPSNPQEPPTMEMPQQIQTNETEPIELNEENEFDPSMDNGNEKCPQCGQMMTPTISNETFVVSKLVGITNEPKSRVCLEVYGGLHVKVANYAKCQSDTPYLIFDKEIHFTQAISEYAELKGKILKNKLRSSQGPRDPYEEWGRLSPQYQGEYPEGIVTVRKAWLRSCAFNILDDDDAKRLKDKYPHGVKVILVNDEFAEACDESLDDHWTLTRNPMSDYIHHDPLGLLLVSIQELTNDLISLTIQTIEHGIPQTFADPGVLSFDAYRQMESIPGGIYEATPKSGKSVSDAFHEVKTATLSGEVLPFADKLQSMGQLASGAMPTIFGGALAGGGETASEYSMSRAQSLQRLQNNWKMLIVWWKTIFGKAIPMYIKEVKEDERDVQRGTDGNFINIFIRKAELDGKIGRVELEANENLPITWSQRKDVVMKLLEAGNPEILAMLGAPENLPIIREAIGLDDFYVPGEDDRERQFEEIRQLLNSEPMPNPAIQMIGMEVDPMTGQPIPPEIPSVEIDPDFDDHEIQFEICRKFILSEEGQITKTDNPNGYRNVLLHGKAHMEIMQQQALAAQQAQVQASAPSKKPGKSTKEPITGEGDVATQ